MAVRMQEDGVLDQWVKERYQGWDRGMGLEIESRKARFQDLEKWALQTEEPSLVSGRQESYEGLLNSYL